MNTETTCTLRDKDLAAGASGLLIWGLPALGLIVTAEAGGLYRDIGWPALLAFMGVACFLNVRRCSRVHCYVTGPFFLVLALLALLLTFDVISLGEDSWSRLTTILLIGSVAFFCIPEWLLGRYRSKAQNC